MSTIAIEGLGADAKNGTLTPSSAAAWISRRSDIAPTKMSPLAAATPNSARPPRGESHAAPATLGEIGRGCGRAGAGGLTRIRGAGRDPGAEGGERVVVEALAPLRHLQPGQLVSQNGEESAVLWSTGNEDRPPCPTGAHSLAVVEDEPTFRRTITAVAFLAVLDEHRADPGFEQIKGVIGREPRRRDRAEHHRRPQAGGQTALDGTTTPAR